MPASNLRNMSPTQRRNSAIGTVGMGVIFMVIAAVLAINQWKFVGHAVTARAKIVNLINPSTIAENTAYTPVYEFTVQQGEKAKVYSSVPSYPHPGKVGDTIEVLYDPQNPRNSTPKDFFNIWGASAELTGMGVTYLLMYLAFIFLPGRRLRNYCFENAAIRGNNAKFG
jgi:hypothetical protein